MENGGWRKYRIDTEQRWNGRRAEKGRAGDALRASLVEWRAIRPAMPGHRPGTGVAFRSFSVAPFRRGEPFPP